MSGAGSRRPVVTRGVFAIEDHELLLPDPIALDTGFVVEALLANQPLHGVCDAVLTRIFDNGVSVVTSELLRVELAESAFAITLKEHENRLFCRLFLEGERRDSNPRPPGPQLEYTGFAEMRFGLLKRFTRCRVI
jgi:hypothetical protein